MTDAIREAAENKRLRRLIDLTWGHVHEDESVPSTSIHDQLIAQLDREMPPTVTDEMVEVAARAMARQQGQQGTLLSPEEYERWHWPSFKGAVRIVLQAALGVKNG